MNTKLLNLVKSIKIAIGLAFFVLLGFGLKTCVFDHNNQLDAAMAWCEANHIAYENNPKIFIANQYRYQRGDYKLFIENTAIERKMSLPTEFFVSEDGTAECEIVYCAKIGLSRCRYDREKNDVISISD